MAEDEIIAQVRAIREAWAARFNYDMDAIFQDVKEREKRSTRRVITVKPKRIKPVVAAGGQSG